MRLIDADELEKDIEHEYEETIKSGGIEQLRTVWKRVIKDAPTVTPDKIQAIMREYLIYRTEPQRPTWECKTCKYFQKSINENANWGWCSIRRVTQEGILETQVPKDYYCSWFEKGAENV